MLVEQWSWWIDLCLNYPESQETYLDTHKLIDAPESPFEFYFSSTPKAAKLFEINDLKDKITFIKVMGAEVELEAMDRF